MNTHDIELPAEFRSGNDIPVTQSTIKRGRMEEILRDAIEADRKRRGEPVYCSHPKCLTAAGCSGSCSKAAPQPAEPVNPNEEYKPEYKYCEDGKVVWTNAADAPVVKSAEPVKVPSDAQLLLDMIDTLCTGLEWNIENHPEVMNESDAEALAEARDLLARYGSGQPETGKTVLVENQVVTGQPAASKVSR